MPMLTTCIEKVGERRIGRLGKLRKFDVYTTEALAPWGSCFETWNQFTASLCARAAQLQRPVRLALRETRWGLEIVEASLKESTS